MSRQLLHATAKRASQAGAMKNVGCIFCEKDVVTLPGGRLATNGTSELSKVSSIRKTSLRVGGHKDNKYLLMTGINHYLTTITRTLRLHMFG